jgi:uncharacterized protein YdcH (DUF465 family)
MKKRTFGFDEYQKKISENIEEIGFRKYVQEHEEESVSVDAINGLDIDFPKLSSEEIAELKQSKLKLEKEKS